MFMQLFFSKVNPACPILQTVSNEEVTLEKLIGMLWIAQKLYFGA